MEYRASDVGASLISSQFARDRDDVVAYAFDAGVDGLLITGINLRESQQARKLTRQYSSYWSTAGVHPYDSSQWQTATEKAIIRLATQPEVAAIGKCGLDFSRNLSTSEKQERAFAAQLHIAADLDMPVFMYCRNVHKWFTISLEPWLNKLSGVVLHCFTGICKEVQAHVTHGIYIGAIDWVCDERCGLELQELLPLIPTEKLLIKTNAPHLLPRDLTPRPSSRRNEPARLPHILQRIAHWRGEGAAWLTTIAGANVKTLSGIVF